MRLLFRLSPAALITTSFLTALLALTLIFYGKLPYANTLILTYFSLLVIQAILLKGYSYMPFAKKSGVAEYSRNLVFPVICVFVIFDSLEWLVHYINPRDIDPLLIRLDYLIFNNHPTVLLEALHTPVLTDLLQLSYTSYYFLPIFLGIILKFRRRDGEFDRSLFLILFCFYLSFIGYVLFPALGPRYTINHLQTFDLKGLYAAEAIQELLNRLEGIKRDAFPSGHTAVTLVVSILAYRYHKGYFYITLPVVAMLIFATVYCRYHYVVDVIGGILLVWATFFIGERLYEYWEDREERKHINN